MATPSEAVMRRQDRRKTLSGPSKIPNSALCSSYLKQEFLLHDWWLIKVDSDYHGKRLGIGGFTSRGNQGVRCFSSAPIIERHDAVTLTTADGITIMVNGHLNRSRTHENGFSHEVCDHFVIGFPYYWEEFASTSDDEEPETTKFSASDEHKMPNSSDMLRRNIFDETQGPSNGKSNPSSGPSVAAKKRSRAVKNVLSCQEESPSNDKKVMDEQIRTKHELEDVEFTHPLTRSIVEHTATLAQNVRLTRSRARLLNK